MLSSLLSISLITITANADCKSDCQVVIDACKYSIQTRDKLIQDQNTEITDLQKALNSSRQETQDSNQALTRWYHNPVIMGVLGIAIGGATIVYLSNK
jgi:hypothetical protein